MKYIVIEQHYGDRQYWAGDEREVKDPETAAYLIAQKLIALPEGVAQNTEADDAQPQTGAQAPEADDAQPQTDAQAPEADAAQAKAEAAPQNKAAQPPKNKAGK